MQIVCILSSWYRLTQAVLEKSQLNGCSRSGCSSTTTTSSSSSGSSSSSSSSSSTSRSRSSRLVNGTLNLRSYVVVVVVEGRKLIKDVR